MNVKIQAVKFDADRKLVDFINGKVNKLERFFDGVVHAEVFLKVDKDHDNGNKVVTMRLEVPGNALVADFRSKSFEESVDECVEALKKQLEKHKGRQVK